MAGRLGSVSSLLTSTGTAATGAGTSIAAIAGPIGIAIAAVAGLAVGAGVLVKGLFDLAAAAAEWRGALFDTSQQLGISTETLSALEILAKTTGSSLDGITASLGIFQKKLEEAQDPTSKEAKLLNELGISSTNTEESLRQTLKALAAMPEGFHQTATALEIFGRGGKSMLAILKEMDGDLDGAIDKFREMGLVVSQEDAKAADEFNDQLATLQFQIRALLGNDVIPAALAALKDMSALLKENQQEVRVVGQVFGILATVVASSVKSALGEVRVLLAALNQAAIYIDRLRGTTPIRDVTPEGEYVSPGSSVPGASPVTPYTPKAERGSKVGGGKTDAQRDLERELKARIDLTRDLTAELDKQFAVEIGIDVTTRTYAVSQQLLNTELAKASDEYKQQALEIAQSIDRLLKLNKAQATATQFQKAQAEAVREVIEGTKGHIEITEDFIESLRAEGLVLTQTEQHWLRMRAAILASADAKKMYLNLAAVEVGGAATAGLSDDAIGAAAGRAANELLGAPPPIDPWIEAFAQLKFAGEDAFGALADGIGSLVHNWVLLGNVGPNAMRKMVASVLAGVSAQAAVMAIMELAYGIAALTPWGAAVYGPAPFHFKSAAMFGAVAVAAGVGGRLAAGDAFQSATGGGGSGGGSSQPSTIKPPGVDVNRRNFNDRPIEVRLVLANGAHDFIEASVVNNWKGNGRIRTVVQKDGQG